MGKRTKIRSGKMVSEEIVNSLLVTQKSSWENLIQISKTKKIANGYLFSGPVGSGKEAIALKFSQLLNCESSNDKICYKCGSCIRFNKLQHENLKIITPLPASKNTSSDLNSRGGIFSEDLIKSIKKKSENPFYKISIKNANRILIQSIRELRKILYLKHDQKKGHNIVIIFDAEMLCTGQGESGNALLKILEEPPSNTSIILVTNHKKMLFSTIISRCQQVYFSALSNKFIFNYLKFQNLNDSDAKFFSQISKGNIHKAILLSNDSKDDLINIITNITDTLIDKNVQNWDKFISHYSRLSKNNIIQFKSHFNLISIWFRNAYLHKNNLEIDFDDEKIVSKIIIFNKKFPSTDYYSIIISIENVIKSVSQNLHMPLVLINFMIDLQEYINEK